MTRALTRHTMAKETTNRDRARMLAPIQITAGATMISFSAVFVKWAHVGPTTAGFYRMLFGGVILTALVLVRKENFFYGTLHFIMVCACSLFFAFDLTFWHRSIHYIGPGLATLLANFQIFFLAMFGTFVLKEKPSWKLTGAMALAILGLYLIVGPNWSSLGKLYRTGVILGIVTAVSYAAYILTLRNCQARISRAAFPTMAWVSLLTTLCLGAEVLFEKESFRIPDPQSWGALVAYGLFSQVLGWVLISKGLPGLEASRAGLLLLLQPTLAFFWDILFFSRATSLLEAMGALLALLAIYLGATARK
jgi:drug/metabolite transporter (DMT)-like permease